MLGVPPLPCRLKAFDAHVTVVRARSSLPDGDAAAARHHIDEYGAGVQDLHRRAVRPTGRSTADTTQPVHSNFPMRLVLHHVVCCVKYSQLCADNFQLPFMSLHDADSCRMLPANLHRLLPATDIVVLTCTQNNATRGIVNGEFLRRCKRGVRIVNVARGGLLDHAAVQQVSSNAFGSCKFHAVFPTVPTLQSRPQSGLGLPAPDMPYNVTAAPPMLHSAVCCRAWRMARSAAWASTSPGRSRWTRATPSSSTRGWC